MKYSPNRSKDPILRLKRCSNLIIYCKIFTPQMLHSERLLTEQRNLRKTRKYLFYALPVDSKQNIVWECGFPGPDIEPFIGSYYTVELTFTKTYPMNPPNVKFKNYVYHPNVYKDGQVCLDIISSKWKPSMNVMSVLSGLQTLLEFPNIKSPANAPAGHLYRTNRKIYDDNVRKNIQEFHNKPLFRRL